ncbi:MAG: hypothetical protein HQM08_13945 [Candidatus Riflebacteria bacterium]|nr:hypothetical protein [Candidatus Riflebacteria bacterium]
MKKNLTTKTIGLALGLMMSLSLIGCGSQPAAKEAPKAEVAKPAPTAPAAPTAKANPTAAPSSSATTTGDKK